MLKNELLKRRNFNGFGETINKVAVEGDAQLLPPKADFYHLIACA